MRDNYSELFTAIRLALAELPATEVRAAIWEANMGRPSRALDAGIPTAPLRRYRNAISGDPGRLVNAATAA